MKKLKILFDNLSDIDINLYDNPVVDVVLDSFKFLKHVKLDVKNHPRDNPYSDEYSDQSANVQRLFKYAALLNLNVVEQPITQEFLNTLHKIYEKNYNGDSKWLEFHEAIHIAEDNIRGRIPSIKLAYREKAGLLEKTFNRSWLQYSTTEIKKGTCYIRWQELGKRPYDYFYDSEPADINRLTELAKPWIYYKPNLFIETYDKNMLGHTDLEKFNVWFKPFKDEWCQHWNLTDWKPEEQYAVIPIGMVTDIELLATRFKNKDFPTRVTP